MPSQNQEKNPWVVFVNPPSNARQNFNHQDLMKTMITHVDEKAEDIRKEFVKAGMEDQIEFVSKMPALYMLSIKATDAAVEKLKGMKEVHSIEPNVFTGQMPEEDRRLLDERRRNGSKPNRPKF